MGRGSLETIEFKPRQVTPDDGPSHGTRESEDLWSRLRREYRTLTSVAAALVAAGLHASLVILAIWECASPAPAHPLGGRSDTDLQWVTLSDASSATASTPSLSSPLLGVVPITGALSMRPPIQSLSKRPAARLSQVSSDGGLAALRGRYIGQIQARIDRAWLRPRTAIGAPTFHCSVQVDQNRQGAVTAVTLLECNGDTHWQLSLVDAIEEASPLPAPPAQAVFAHHVLLEFRAMAYSAGASAQLYAPAGAASETQKPDVQGALNLNAFHTLREAAREQKSQTLTLRIEGSKVEVEPGH